MQETNNVNFTKLLNACNDAIIRYDEAKKAYDARKKENDKAHNKALRKELRYARARVQNNRASALLDLLRLLDKANSRALLSQCSKFADYFVSTLQEAQTREKFIITKSDTIQSLFMRYCDTFSVKKVMKYCEKHNIAIVYDDSSNSLLKSHFDFTNCDDTIRDEYDEADDDDDDDDDDE